MMRRPRWTTTTMSELVEARRCAGSSSSFQTNGLASTSSSSSSAHALTASRLGGRTGIGDGGGGGGCGCGCGVSGDGGGDGDCVIGRGDGGGVRGGVRGDIGVGVGVRARGGGCVARSISRSRLRLRNHTSIAATQMHPSSEKLSTMIHHASLMFHENEAADVPLPLSVTFSVGDVLGTAV